MSIEIVIGSVVLFFLFWIFRSGEVFPKLLLALITIGPSILIYLLTQKVLFVVLYLFLCVIGFFALIMLALKDM